MEDELDSLSGQLANTYEELSLIYQLCSGMKINRRSSDFFKQACLDVMEVMAMRGMGVALRADSIRTQEPVLYGALSLPPGKVHRLAEELMIILGQRKSPLLVNILPRTKRLAGWRSTPRNCSPFRFSGRSRCSAACSASTSRTANSIPSTASC